MSHPEDGIDEINESEMSRTYQFDKFMDDLERRESLRRHTFESVPVEHNQANRRRDASNREALHNRIRWTR